MTLDKLLLPRSSRFFALQVIWGLWFQLSHIFIVVSLGIPEKEDPGPSPGPGPGGPLPGPGSGPVLLRVLGPLFPVCRLAFCVGVHF